MSLAFSSTSSRGGIAARLLAVVALLCVLAASAGYYALRTVLTPAWVRANVVPVLEHEIGRDIVFQDFNLSLRGIVLRRVSLSEDPAFADSGVPFAAVDRIVVGFDLLGLFARMLLIDYVRLDNPAINLVRRSDGTWNTSSLFHKRSAELRAPQSHELGTGMLSDVAPADWVHVVLTSIEIKRGEFRFTNLGARDDNVTLRADDIASSVVIRDNGTSIEYMLEADVTAYELEHTPVSLTGTFRWKTGTLSMHNRIGEIDVDSLVELASALRSEPAADGSANSAAGTAAGGPSGIDRFGKAGLTVESEFTFAGVTYKGVKTGELRLALRRTERRFDIDNLETKLGSGSVSASGTADFGAKIPTYTGKIQLEKLAAEDLVKLTELSGPVAAADGTVTAVVDFAATGTSADEVLASALGTKGNKVPGAYTRARIAVDLDRIDLSDTWKNRNTGDKAAPTSDPYFDTGSLEVEADLSIGEIVVGERNFGSVKTRGALKNGILIVDDTEAKFAEGDLQVRGHLKLVEAVPSFEGNLTVTGLDYQKLLGTVPAKPWIDTDGEITASLDFHGRGFDPYEAWLSMTDKTGDKNPDGYLRGHATVHMNELDLDRIDSELSEEERAHKRRIDPRGLGPFTSGTFTLDADITVDKIRLWNLDYTDAVGKISLNDETIRVDEITAKLAGGDLELAGNVEINHDGLKYEGRASLEGAQVQPFIDAYASSVFGQIGGIGNATAEFGSAGTRKTPALEALKVDGYIALQHGEVTESEMFKRIAKATGVKQFKKLQMTECGGDVTVANQVVSTKHMVLGGKDARLLIIGDVTFQQKIDAEVWLGFDHSVQRELFSTGILLPYVNDGSGWTYIPLEYSGTFADPKVSVQRKAYSNTVLSAPFDATARIVRTGSRLIPGGEKFVGAGIDTVRSILGSVGRLLTSSSQKAKAGAIGDNSALPPLDLQMPKNLETASNAPPSTAEDGELRLSFPDSDSTPRATHGLGDADTGEPAPAASPTQ